MSTEKKKYKFFTDFVAFLASLYLLMLFRLIKVRFLQLLSGRHQKASTVFRVFMDLQFFYRRIIMNFSFLIAPLIKCLKGHTFKWIDEAGTSFH